LPDRSSNKPTLICRFPSRPSLGKHGRAGMDGKNGWYFGRYCG
jgi:hypothetical protein